VASIRERSAGVHGSTPSGYGTFRSSGGPTGVGRDSPTGSRHESTVVVPFPSDGRGRRGSRTLLPPPPPPRPPLGHRGGPRRMFVRLPGPSSGSFQGPLESAHPPSASSTGAKATPNDGDCRTATYRVARSITAKITSSPIVSPRSSMSESVRHGSGAIEGQRGLTANGHRAVNAQERHLAL
jgi:hypothetical protein